MLYNLGNTSHTFILHTNVSLPLREACEIFLSMPNDSSSKPIHGSSKPAVSSRLQLIITGIPLYHPVVYFFYLTSVIFYITVIAKHSNHRLVIWPILANSSGLALSSYFSNSKLNYCCFWYYTSSFERIVSYILFSSYVCTSTFNYPWQILKQYQYNFSGLLQLS